MQVMRWMEQCAYIAASRVGRGSHLLTGSMDSLAFAHPTRVGDTMYITAQVSLISSFQKDLLDYLKLSIFADALHLAI